MKYLGWILLAVLIIVAIVKKLKENNKSTDTETAIDVNTEIEKLPYSSKYLLSKNEWYFYKSLKLIADKYNLHVLTKIRLADLVEVKNADKKEWQKYFNKIQSKHVDFALCQPDNLKILLIIELDDSSHDSAKRQASDKFINDILEKCGYKIIRTRGTQTIETDILSALPLNTQSSKG